MNGPPFRTLGFSPRYTCSVHVGQAGAVRVRFPRRSRTAAGEANALLIDFTPFEAETWTGAFAREFPGCWDALLACPDPFVALVVAGGLGWAINVCAPEVARSLPDDVPVVDAFGDAASGTLFLATLNTVAAYDQNMTRRWVVQFNSDGIRFERLEARELFVEAFEPATESWIKHRLGIDDGDSRAL